MTSLPSNLPRCNAPRLYIEAALGAGVRVDCTAEQANYLVNVMRLARGDGVIVFNGGDGEWLCAIAETGKKRCTLLCNEQLRPQTPAPDLHYLFAPLKHARLDYLVQKATEMGVSRLRPILTHRTVAARVNGERMRANAIEAAEQCDILWVPEIAEPQKLGAVLQDWDVRRRLIFCDESAAVADPLAVLREVAPGPLAVIVGPEGGFDAEERAQLAAAPYARAISLGPRIMRADTAAVAALALVNATLGDWR